MTHLVLGRTERACRRWGVRPRWRCRCCVGRRLRRRLSEKSREPRVNVAVRARKQGVKRFLIHRARDDVRPAFLPLRDLAFTDAKRGRERADAHALRLAQSAYLATRPALNGDDHARSPPTATYYRRSLA